MTKIKRLAANNLVKKKNKLGKIEKVEKFMSMKILPEKVEGY